MTTRASRAAGRHWGLWEVRTGSWRPKTEARARGQKEQPHDQGAVVFNPSACLDEHLMQFKFLGILMGVAIRTKKPLDLHLAPLVWKQLCCVPLTLEDLEEVDLLYVPT